MASPTNPIRKIQRAQHFPLSVWVLISGLALSAAILSATLWVAANDHKASLKAAQANTELLARVLADQATRTLDTGAVALRTMATLPSIRAVKTDSARAEAALQQMLVATPFFREAAVIDVNGQVLASTTVGSKGLTIRIKQMGVVPANGNETLGPRIPGRGLMDLARNADASPAPRGVAFIPMVVGFLSDAGQPLILAGLVNPDYLANLQVLAIGEDGLLSVLTSTEGRVLVSSAVQQPAPDQALSALPIFQQLFPNREFASYVGAGVGGDHQILAYRASRSQPILAIVEEPYAAAEERWLKGIQAFAAVGAAAIVLVLSLTVVAYRSLRAREAAQAHSAHNERELAALMQSIQELVFRTDPNGVLTLVNAHWQPLSGRSIEDAIGQRLQDIAEAEDRAQVMGLFIPDSTLHVRTAHVRLRLSPDRVLRLDVAAVPLRVNGEIVGFAGSAVDVTDRWIAQQRLQAQLAYQDRLLETNPLPISLTDRNDRLVHVNRAWELYQGKSRAQLLGRRLFDVLPAQEARVHQAADIQLLQKGGEITFETTVVSGNGGQRETRVIKTLVPDENGQISGILCTLMDISEFRAAERATREASEAAQEAYRTKSEFVANMSHELRTPLQSIMGFSELGMLRGGQAPKLAAMFADIHASGQRMLALVNDLLDVSKLESTVGTFLLESVELRNLIQPVARELHPLLAKAQLHLNLRLSDFPLIAKADPVRFQQVIRNIIANAIKVSTPGQSIDITCGIDDEGQPHIVIRDYGPGIPEGELESIFEAFVQSSKTKDGSGGTGLGLAICRKIIEALGGKIYARNAAQGGAAFHVVLPPRGMSDTVPASL